MTDSYRPSNGTEGDIFHAIWCANCVKDRPETDDMCPILCKVYAFDIGEPGYPSEWIWGEGEPLCTAFTDANPPTEADKKYMEWKEARP